jgi:hypothetical protein
MPIQAYRERRNEHLVVCVEVVDRPEKSSLFDMAAIATSGDSDLLRGMPC